MVLFVTSCNTTQTLYTWYNYEDVAYEYNKEPTEERQVKVLEQYKKLTDKQRVSVVSYLLACMQNMDIYSTNQGKSKKVLTS